MTRKLENQKRSETAILLILTLLTCAAAAWMWYLQRASWLEAVSFVTGAMCVWLTVRENVWNFPLGLLNVVTFSVVFFTAGLYADAGLQVVYFVLGCIGWYWWIFGGKHRSRLRIGYASRFEIIALAAFVLVSTGTLWAVLSHVGGSASFWDALTTSISLASQWLLNRKRMESWLGWIIVDVIYVPLYIYKGLYLTAGLYTVFLCMAIMGLLHWRATWIAENARAPAQHLPARAKP